MANGNSNIEQTATGFTVYPTGVFPTDVDNVRWAVDNTAPGGTVNLKAASRLKKAQYFNFGEHADPNLRGGVNVQHDVVITGEPTNQRFLFPPGRKPDEAYTPTCTVIYGGQRPIHCDATNAVAAQLAVRRIFFAYPAFGAVQVKKSSGLEVSDCVVYDATGIALQWFPFPSVAEGIEATGLLLPKETRELRGNLRVFNNIVKRSADFDQGWADGGIVVQKTDMDAEIRNNTIVGFAFAGIGVDDNTRDVLIRDNAVTSCGYGAQPQSGGIGVRRSGAPGPANAPRVTMRNNTITGGSMVRPDGMRFYSKNGITLCGSSGVVVKENRISGAVESNGILVTPFTPSAQPGQPQPASTPSRENMIEGNNLKDLVAGHAQQHFDATCDRNQSKSNDLGAVDLASGVAGIVVHSNDNDLTNETFWGDYPGTKGAPDVACVWLVAGTSGNRVTALKRGDGIPAFDLCTQVQNDDPANDVPGYESCPHVDLADIMDRERQHCLHEGGTWSDATHTCTLVSA
jgi:hypothetical protein